jgi:hypothetical protein
MIILKLFVDRIGSRTVRSEAEYEEILRDLEEKEVASCFLKEFTSKAIVPSILTHSLLQCYFDRGMRRICENWL